MDFTCVADDLTFPEGPIVRADGSVLVVEIRAGRLTRVLPDGTKTVVADLGGGPNGAAIGPDGSVYVCNNGGLTFQDAGGLAIPGHAPADYRTGSIQRVDLATGAAATLYDACDGRALRGPNDIVFDAEGGFWFTDYGKSDDWTLDRGYLLYARADGSDVQRVRGGFLGPNGVGLSPDGVTLYVAETLTGRLWALDIVGPGGALAPPPVPWAPGRLVATLPGHQMIDSLAVEAGGRICVAGGPDGGITIIDPDGSHMHVSIPGEVIVTNICFGGQDMRDAWITASGSGRLYRTRWPRPGLPLAFGS